MKNPLKQIARIHAQHLVNRNAKTRFADRDPNPVATYCLDLCQKTISIAEKSRFLPISYMITITGICILSTIHKDPSNFIFILIIALNSGVVAQQLGPEIKSKFLSIQKTIQQNIKDGSPSNLHLPENTRKFYKRAVYLASLSIMYLLTSKYAHEIAVLTNNYNMNKLYYCSLSEFSIGVIGMIQQMFAVYTCYLSEYINGGIASSSSKEKKTCSTASKFTRRFLCQFPQARGKPTRHRKNRHMTALSPTHRTSADNRHTFTLRRFDLSRTAQTYEAKTPTAYIGDIHGRYAILQNLIDEIENISPGIPKIMLGDITDRGENSLDCLKLAIKTRRARPENKYLIGNHEQMLLGTLLDHSHDTYSGNFVLNGGEWLLDLAHAYGDKEPTAESLRKILSDATGEQDIVRAICGDSDELTKKLVSGEPTPELVYHLNGDVLAAHAGINCSTDNIINRLNNRATILPPDDTRIFAMTALWTRGQFLSNTTKKGAFPYLIVHGHTPEHRTPSYTNTDVSRGDIRPRGCRLGLDGGAASSQTGAAAIITGHEVITIFVQHNHA